MSFILKDAGIKPDDLSIRRFQATINAGGVMRHSVPTSDGLGLETIDFVIDLSSVVCDDLVPVDYDHESKEIVGYCQNIRVERRNGAANKLVGDGALIPCVPGDRASEIAYKSQFVPYGISPTLDLESARRVDLKDGETRAVNDAIVTGPLTVYENVPMLGVSICPYPTDNDTSIETLKRKTCLTQRNEGERIMTEPIRDAAVETPLETPEETPSVKDAELQKYIDKFGLEAGVRFYQEGKSFEDAISERFDELNAQVTKMNETCDPAKKEEETLLADEDEEETKLADDATSDEEEKKKEATATPLKKEVQTLRKALTELARHVDRMAAVYLNRSGESTPVPGGVRGKNGTSYQAAFKEAFDRQDRVR